MGKGSIQEAGVQMGIEGLAILMSGKRGCNRLDRENAVGKGTVVGICRPCGCREQVGLVAADRPAVAVGVGSVQKSWFQFSWGGFETSD